MYVVSFAQGQPDWQSRIDANRSTIAYIKVASTKVACDCGCFFFCEVPRAFVWPEGRRGSTRKCAIVIEVLLGGEIRWANSIYGRSKGGHSWNKRDLNDVSGIESKIVVPGV